MGMKAVHRPVSNRQPAPKETKKKKTLKEVVGTMLSDMAQKAKEERLRPLREMQKAQEDEIAVLIFGPEWEEPENDQAAPEPPVDRNAAE